MTTYTISGTGTLPDRTTPLSSGAWYIGLPSGYALNEGEGFSAGVEKAVLAGSDGSASVTLPETTGDDYYTAYFWGRDKSTGASIRLPSSGVYQFTLTADCTWDDVMETPTVPPMTPSLVAEAQGAADRAEAAASQAVWTASTDYSAGDVVVAPDGSTVSRDADGTSAATWDADADNWTSTLTGDTVAAAALSGAFAEPSTRELVQTAGYSTLLPWYAALAQRETSRVTIACSGDSIFEGYSLTNFADTLPQQIAKALRRRLGITGSGRGFVGYAGTNTPSPWALSGGAAALNYFSPKELSMNIPSGGKATLTPGAGLTAFKYLIYTSPSGAAGGGYYKIDGGSAVTFNTYSAAATPVAVDVTATATSSIEFGSTSGSFVLAGVIEYASDKTAGILVHNCGLTNSWTSQWNATLSGGWLLWQATMNPTLVLIDLGINDARTAAGNKDSGTYKSDMLTLIANYRAIGVHCPIGLMIDYGQDDSTMREPYANYVAKMREIADADSTVFVIDHGARMYGVTDPDSVGLYNASFLPHASPKGYALMAETIATALMPR